MYGLSSSAAQYCPSSSPQAIGGIFPGDPMHIHLIIACSFLAILIWVGIVNYLQFRAATGTIWQRLLAMAEQSAVILWNKFVILIGAVSALLIQLADYLGAPELSGPIQSVLSPKLVPFYVIGIAF